MYAIFVKKDMSKKDWEFYSKVSGYMYLGKSRIGVGEDIEIAFMCPSADQYGPEGTTLLSDDELRRYDAYCRANNIYPRPFEDVQITKEKTIDEVGRDKMGIIKDWLHKKKGMFKV